MYTHPVSWPALPSANRPRPKRSVLLSESLFLNRDRLLLSSVVLGHGERLLNFAMISTIWVLRVVEGARLDPWLTQLPSVEAIVVVVGRGGTRHSSGSSCSNSSCGSCSNIVSFVTVIERLPWVNSQGSRGALAVCTHKESMLLPSSV